MQRVYGFVWPESQEKGAAAPWYYGFRTAIGQYKKPTIHENAALLLFEGAAPKMAKLVARNAGYNFGLVGIAHEIRIKAGGAASLPLVFIAADKPDDGAIDLPAILEGARPKLLPEALPQ